MERLGRGDCGYEIDASVEYFLKRQREFPYAWWYLQLWHDLLVGILTSVRDRLRCPMCKAVGTWKPHGGPFYDNPCNHRRWLCKCCGLLVDKKGIRKASPVEDAWVEGGEYDTTYEVLIKLARERGNDRDKVIWPWFG